jgi:subtilisin family serine protease
VIRKTLLVCFALLASLLVPATSMAASPVDQYIVVLKDNVDSGAVADQHKGRYGARLKYVYGHALKGYAARIPEKRVADVRADSRVAYVEPDGEAKALATQTGATWGIDRIDQPNLPLSNTFSYTNTGVGVKAYIIDTGIRFSHDEFGGRAVSGTDAIDGGTADDCDGHGTHVAGTTGGQTWGVAKGVTLVGVRVLDCNGSGTWSGVIEGIDWVTGHHPAGAPAVANMSLGGGANTAVDDAVRRSITDGVSYAIAAGNGNWGGRAQDACKSSPARVSAAMTISATNSSDAKASWANYGSCVDWFAPGVGITSSTHESNTASDTWSGTSMATPHTAGVAVLYLEGNTTASPSTVRNALYTASTKGKVTNSRTTNNHLLFKNGW